MMFEQDSLHYFRFLHQHRETLQRSIVDDLEQFAITYDLKFAPAEHPLLPSKQEYHLIRDGARSTILARLFLADGNTFPDTTHGGYVSTYMRVSVKPEDPVRVPLEKLAETYERRHTTSVTTRPTR